MTRSAAIALLTFASVAGSAPTLAAPVSQVVPYSGYLDRDGAPTDGAV